MQKLQLFFYRYLSSRFLGSIVYNAFMIYFLWELVVAFKSVFLAGLIPTIALAADLVTAVPVGHLIDRYNSTKLGMLSSVLLLFGIGLLVTHQTIYLVYAATVFVSIGVMMKGDAISATIKKHLDQEQFTAANQNLQGAGFASSLIGTVFGGASIIFLRESFVFVLLALSITAFILSFPIPEQANEGQKETALSGLASSIGFIKKIVGFLAVGFVLNGLLISLDVYSSGLFHLVLKASPIYYTLFVSFLSIGGIIGAVILGKIQKYVNTAYRVSFLILLFSPAILFIALSRTAIGDIADSLLIGILIPVINIPLQANLMKIVPRNIYGKVMAFLRVFLGGATPAMAAVFSFMALFMQVNIILLYVGIIVFPIGTLAFLVLPKFFEMAKDESASTDNTSGT